MTTAFTAVTVPFRDRPLHETIWAIAAGPGPLIQVAVCCEATGGGTVHLYSYDTRTGQMAYALDVAAAIGEDPEDGHATHGKVHFALCPARDGWVYAATHCSTPPKGDTLWSALDMWNHPRKSFTGGHLFRYRPGTDEFEDFGILYRNQGIPLLALDETVGRLVGATYPAANLFIIDRDGTGFTDLGRISYDYPLNIVLDGQGFAYTSDTHGYLVRIDLRARRFELLPSRIPVPEGASGMASPLSDSVLGPDGYVYAVTYQISNLFRFRPQAQGPVEIEDFGPILPDSDAGFFRGLIFGPDRWLYGALWAPYDPDDRPVLLRFHPETQQREVLGSLHVDGAPRRYWRAVKGADGRFYCGECGRKPVSLLIIDPSPKLPASATARGEVLGPQRSEPVPTEQVDIVSIHGLRTPQSVMEIRRGYMSGAGKAGLGQTYGIGLAWPPPAVVPVDEASVTALAVDEHGGIWGATSGNAAHVLWMPTALQVGDVGPIPDTHQVADRLVIGKDRRLYGAGGEPGGQLFSVDTTTAVLFKYIRSFSPIRLHGPVFADDGVATLALAADGVTLLCVGSHTGQLCLLNLETGRRALVDPVAPSPDGPRLVVAAAGNTFYGITGAGDLFRLGTDAELKIIGPALPGGADSVTALAMSRHGNLLIGTAGGRLLCGDPATRERLDCGQPDGRRCLRSLAAVDDGRIYAIAGAADDLSRLVCWSPAGSLWQDLGLVKCAGEFPWVAFRLGPMLADSHSRLVIGENDRFGHIFLHHP